MNVAVTCPTTVRVAFVVADHLDAARPRFPFTCPCCARAVEHPADHPGGPSIDDLIEFPHLLCGGDLLLAEAGARRASIPTTALALAA